MGVGGGSTGREYEECQCWYGSTGVREHGSTGVREVDTRGPTFIFIVLLLFSLQLPQHLTMSAITIPTSPLIAIFVKREHQR